MDIKECSAYLKLALPTLYEKTSQSIIPFCKRGKKLYFKKSEIDQWLQEGRRKTNAEIDREAELYLAKRKP